jgi:uncharacterized membrane protein YeaQ/YmgE (transglycosylase-associated protein family)
MSLQAAVVLLGVGLLAGWLSGAVMKVGGHGLKTDLALGVGGSFAGAASFYLLASAADAGWISMVAGAAMGATMVLVVQRMFWAMRPAPTRTRRS